MGSLPYFKFYAQDWLGGTLDLTLEERGAYITLLAWSWEKGPLPLEIAKRARIVGVSVTRWDALWNVLSEYWQDTEVGTINPRLEEEREKLAEQHEGLSEAGKRGAERRWAAYRLKQAQANAAANGQAIDPATGEVTEVAND